MKEKGIKNKLAKELIIKMTKSGNKWINNNKGNFNQSKRIQMVYDLLTIYFKTLMNKKLFIYSLLTSTDIRSIL
jgi:hypothetical protein